MLTSRQPLQRNYPPDGHVYKVICGRHLLKTAICL